MIKNVFKPQFSVDDYYRQPFTRERVYDAQLNKFGWQPRNVEQQLSGVNILDTLFAALNSGRSAQSAARDLGLSIQELDMGVLLLTGVKARQAEQQWRARRAADLLRYTTLKIKDVMKRCRFSNLSAFTRFCRQHLGRPAASYRKAARQPGDAGRYAP